MRNFGFHVFWGSCGGLEGVIEPVGVLHIIAKLRSLIFGIGFVLFAVLIALSVVAPARAGEEMSFQIVSVGDPARCGADCPQIISAEGEISDQTPGIFRAFVREHYQRSQLHAIVLLDSYGGKVLAAMELGRIFRQIGAAVIVAQTGSGSHFAGGRCFSACVYALMGGKKRVIPPESQAGVHRMVAYDNGYDSQFLGGVAARRLDNGSVGAVLARYSAAMGVNPAIIALAEHTSPDGLHVLSRSEIARWHLAASQL